MAEAGPERAWFVDECEDPGRRYAARIVFIGDGMDAPQMAQSLEKQGYHNVEVYLDTRRGAEALLRSMPDLVVMRWKMPKPDGQALLTQLVLDYADEVSVIALMELADRKCRLKALAAGAQAVIEHPVDRLELLLRVRNLLEAHFLRQDMRAMRRALRSLDRRSGPSQQRSDGMKRSKDMGTVYAGEPQLERIAKLWQVLDPARWAMGEQVSALSVAIGEHLGMEWERLRQLRSAATIYDFGMLAVPPEVRNSEEKLDVESMAAIRRHVEAARAIFDGAEFTGADTVREVVSLHHERWDGMGYPNGLRGEAIPLAAQIVSVAQFFVALLSDREYRAALSLEEALMETVREKGFALSPRVVEALEALHHAPQPEHGLSVGREAPDAPTR